MKLAQPKPLKFEFVLAVQHVLNIFRLRSRSVSFWNMSALPRTLAAFALAFTVGRPYAQAQQTCEAVFQSQDRVVIKNSAIEQNNFTIGRGLELYSKHFPFQKTPPLLEKVKTLPFGSTWVDMGAGEGNALIDGLEKNWAIKGVGIAYKMPNRYLPIKSSVKKRFQYISGDYVENLAKDGKLKHLVNKAALITDLFGPLSYSENLPELLQIYFDLLKPDGELIFNLMDGRFISRKRSQGINQILNSDSHGISAVIAWLKTIPGIEVIDTSEFKMEAYDEWETSVGIRIKKIQSQINVPLTLKTIKYAAGTPPARLFSRLDQPQLYHRSRPSDHVREFDDIHYALLGVLGVTPELKKEQLGLAGYSLSDFHLEAGPRVINGWQITGAQSVKMKRLLSNLQEKGIQVVYDPEFLKTAEGAYLQGNNILMIDTETLRTGVPSVILLHELRHIGLFKKQTMSIAPVSMSLSMRADSSKAIAGAAYKENMSFQELSTHLQDFQWLASNALSSKVGTQKRKNYLKVLIQTAQVVEAGLHRYAEFFENTKALSNKPEEFKYALKQDVIHELTDGSFELQLLRQGEYDIMSVDGKNKNSLMFHVVRNDSAPEARLAELLRDTIAIRDFAQPLLRSQADKWSEFIAKLQIEDPDNLDELKIKAFIEESRSVARDVTSVLRFSTAPTH